MATMISKEKRDLISRGWKAGMTAVQMAEAYGVPARTIRHLLKRERDTGTMEPASRRNAGKKPALDAATVAALKAAIQQKPDIHLQELKDTLGLNICISALSRYITKKLRFTRKTKASDGRAETL